MLNVTSFFVEFVAFLLLHHYLSKNTSLFLNFLSAVERYANKRYINYWIDWLIKILFYIQLSILQKYILTPVMPTNIYYKKIRTKCLFIHSKRWTERRDGRMLAGVAWSTEKCAYCGVVCPTGELESRKIFQTTTFFSSL